MHHCSVHYGEVLFGDKFKIHRGVLPKLLGGKLGFTEVTTELLGQIGIHRTMIEKLLGPIGIHSV